MPRLVCHAQDGGGSIDSKELKDLMASVGQNPTDDELQEMIRIADADGARAGHSPPRLHARHSTWAMRTLTHERALSLLLSCAQARATSTLPNS